MSPYTTRHQSRNNWMSSPSRLFGSFGADPFWSPSRSLRSAAERSRQLSAAALEDSDTDDNDNGDGDDHDEGNTSGYDDDEAGDSDGDGVCLRSTTSTPASTPDGTPAKPSLVVKLLYKKQTTPSQPNAVQPTSNPVQQSSGRGGALFIALPLEVGSST